MLKVHLRSGRTLTVDLQNQEDAKKWACKFDDQKFQDEITGLGICHDGVHYAVPMPYGFRRSKFEAEPFMDGNGGERIFCFADETRLAVTVSHGQRAARIQLSKPGRRVFGPRD